MAAVLAIAGPLLGAAGSLSGLFGNNGASSVPMASNYQIAPQMLGGAANNSLDTISAMGGNNTWNIPQATNVTNTLNNNPGAQSWMNGAQGASNMGQAAAGNAFGAGGNQYAGANAVMNTAFDPQNALYQKSLQQTQDQQNVANSRAGVATSPYGAGLADQNLQNFNIGWQNNQLNRQTQGLGAATSANQAGAGLQQGATNLYGTSSALPYNAWNTIYGNQFGALQNLGQFGNSANAIPQQQVQDWNSILGIGNQQAGTANSIAQTGLNQNNMAFNQNQVYGNQLGQSLQGLGKAWGNYNSGSGSGNPYSTSSLPNSGLGGIY